MNIPFRSVPIAGQYSLNMGNTIRTETKYDMSDVRQHILYYPLWLLLVNWRHLLLVPLYSVPTVIVGMIVFSNTNLDFVKAGVFEVCAIIVSAIAIVIAYCASCIKILHELMLSFAIRQRELPRSFNRERLLVVKDSDWEMYWLKSSLGL